MELHLVSSNIQKHFCFGKDAAIRYEATRTRCYWVGHFTNLVTLPSYDRIFSRLFIMLAECYPKKGSKSTTLGPQRRDSEGNGASELLLLRDDGDAVMLTSPKYRFLLIIAYFFG
jgi:hypothetical protein